MSVDEQGCVVCGARLDAESCAGVCKGCLQPERIEAQLAALPDGPLKDAMVRGGRDFGVIPPDSSG